MLKNSTVLGLMYLNFVKIYCVCKDQVRHYVSIISTFIVDALLH